MTSGGEDSRRRVGVDAGDRTRANSRRAFLTGAGALLTALSGCTFNVNVGGGDSAPAPRTAAAAATDVPTRAPTATPSPTETETPSPTESPTPTASPEPRVVVMTVEAQPVLLESTTPVPTATPDPLRYRLERPYLYVVAASDAAFDGPNTEEIYGEISVSATDGTNEVRTTTGDGLLWRADRNSAREIAEGAGRVLTDAVSPVEFVFPDAAAVDPDDAYIQVDASFREADKGANADDEFVMYDSADRWYLDGPTVEPGYSTATGESRFVIEYTGNGTVLNFSYNIVAL